MPSIAFIVSHSSAGGAQELWSNIAETFAARGHQVFLVAFYPYKGEVRKTQTISWKYILKRKPVGIADQIAAFLRLARFLRSTNVEYAFTALPAANVVVPLAAAFARCRTKVITSHHGPAETYNRLLRKADAVVSKLTRVSKIVCVSNTVAESLVVERGDCRKRIVIKNALSVPIESLISSLLEKYPPNARCGRTVVATGRLARQKNYKMLLRAAVHMPDVRIRIVGTGPEEADLKDLAETLGVANRIEFLGFRQREDAISILAQGDVFVQPSLYEGHSLALVEAAKLGIPLVVTNVPVQVEAITASDGSRCGIAVELNDARALAETILDLLRRKDLYNQYVARAQQLGEEFSFGTMIAQYERLLA
ncbi:hypothetical protein C7U92_20380 [Bradyrhizobium sp. WBOS7]|uniref:Glycosyltransferase n=1 Tax=Bradyrhizobium betae TaxID=244734 RepID=A0AAE9N6C0_9BRAD|nr:MULTISPECIES: glycosyltransferase [Bradyrhizobium]MDD1572974.1 hypothetical protein [Bradyrhizobium sp. WBOS1]UUO33166.1 hypothetical protein DCK84_00275 [Bradyrhizobium sp. WBOS01]MDD1529419.1 hypothetical protein [Bradyrhizobium sp. WBOS2]MDD1579053.1 hypothetical protein [Bradyrhizobium sp. WBOS7]MDD1601860.1 hypothetical protein [Bradyrhizobium sp. WBOS16]